MTEVLVDSSWTGNHGIARYSREVIDHLEIEHRTFELPLPPSSLSSLIRPRPGTKLDLIYSPGYNAGLSRAPQLITVHDLIQLRFGGVRHRVYFETVVKPAIRRTGRVLTVSETSRQDIQDWLDDPAIDVVVTGNSCSDTFTPPPVPQQRSYFLYVGNMRDHKNYALILSALARVSSSQLISVIPSREHGDATRAAEAAGVSARVSLVSDLKDSGLRDLYRGAYALVFPSLMEGYGLPALEAISCGTPVIYWRGCHSVHEIVGQSGVAVGSSNDADAWSDAMVKVASEGLVTHAATKRSTWADVADRVRVAILDSLPPTQA